ncbi:MULTISPECIES: CDP-glucose 4,6-dehydratase [unclassified Cupriavidus]|uniref:CDP-glucose 4,6-dehydratase n=1 Tax=unclassified Cupriavidus TaxID=2640874 RepID=UPI00040D3602|nr:MULTISPECIES: CDP-glucose 4,6-dehydratase [unclassified Cupriavidus]MBP0634002.1 CDP-glucose 4,6-dehydratase [Cupriavidus sp. AcVe19-6a]
MNSAFWRGKRVFLTGHTGFKGSWLSLWLQSLGAELTGFALSPPTRPSLFDEAHVSGGMRSIIGDIRDLPALRQAMHSAQPEIVIHMAAQPLVRYSYQNPVETYATNVMGTVHLFEAVRNTPGVKAVVNITTDKCYENREWVWGYRENEPMGGYDPYSNSKGCAELVSAAYRSSFFNATSHAQHGIALATVRAGNVIGAGDWAQDRLIPDILTAFEQGKIVSIRNPHAIRPWQHVLEPLRGYLILAERLHEQGPAFAEGWNLGPSDEDAKPVGWIVEQLAEMWGNGARWQIDTGHHPHEATYLKLDVSKARSRLNWRPILRLNDALKLIVDWAKQRQAGTDIRQLTLAQIHGYQTLIKS